MKRLFVLLAIIVFWLSFSIYSSELFDGWIKLNNLHDGFNGPVINLLEIKNDKVLVEIKLEGFEVKTLVEDGTKFKQIISPGTPSLQEIGKPDLPQFGRFLQLPFGSDFSFNILEKETIIYNDVLIYPVQRMPERSRPGFTYPFYIDKEFYDKDTAYPSEIISLGDQGVLRDVFIARLGVCPFQYNPYTKKLYVHKSIIVEIHINAGIDSYLFNDYQISHSFHNIYSKILLNYKDNSTDISLIPGPMLVFVADGLEESIMPLIEWKNSKGIKVYKIMMSELAADPSVIKEAIQDAYDSYYPKPAYVLLVGHTETIPPNYISLQNFDMASDYPYTLLKGDQYPDILIGRILAHTPDQVKVQVSKIVNYEQNPYLGTGGDFYSKAFGIASNEGFNPSDEEYALFIGDSLLSGTYEHYDLFFQSMGTATAENITDAINDGRTFGTYLGHGSGTSWLNTNNTFDTLTIHGLNNGFKLPVIIDVACYNGAFDKFDECFGEAWMWAGTPQAPKGAVGYYGASMGTSWHPPAIMAQGIAKHHFEDPVYSFGGSCLAGQMYLAGQLGWTYAVYLNFVWYNLFGDPSMLLRTADPKVLYVEHADLISANQNYINISVNSDQGPVEGALICVYAENNSEIYNTAFTDPAGNAVINFNTQALSTDDIRITVSGYNTSVYHGSIQVEHISDGIIYFDRTVYSCSDIALISLIDSDLAEFDFWTVNVYSDTNPDGIEFTLSATDIPGLLEGELHIGTDIQVLDNDTLSVSYFDENTGHGNQSFKTDTAYIDCNGPLIIDMQVIEISSSSARLKFSTNKEAITMIRYGTMPDNLNITQNVSQSLRLNHNIKITGLEENQRYYFEITGLDSLGNESISQIYSFRTLLILKVGEGDEELVMAPLYCTASINRTQVIYLSSDLGNDPLLISSVSMDITAVPAIPLFNWTIRMKHTHREDYSEGHGFETDGWTLVHQSNLEIDDTGLITFLFETPFYYNGEDNLMVDFSFFNEHGINPPGKVKWTSANSSRTLYAFSNTDGDPLIWKGNTYPTTHVTNHYINLQFGLVPTGPEPYGTVEFDRKYYTCGSNVTVTVKDSNTFEDSLTVTIISTADNEGLQLLLTETLDGIFVGQFTLGIDLEVFPADSIMVIYVDEDIGNGTSLEKYDFAIIDCIAPEISNIQLLEIYGNFARISFDTDKPANSKVVWGFDADDLAYESIISNEYKTEHKGIIEGLMPDAEIFYRIIAKDHATNTAISDCYSFLTENMLHIGNGTVQKPNIPFNVSYSKNRTSVIYMPEDFGINGKTKEALPLSSISLNIAEVPLIATVTLNNFTIRLKHTQRQDFSDDLGMEAHGWTIVYQNDEPLTDTGWNTFEFMDFPFIYDGVSNLMVDISFDNDIMYIGNTAVCYWTASDTPRTTHAFTNSAFFGCPLHWEGTTNPIKHKAYLILNLIFEIDGSGIPFPPTNLTAGITSSTSINLAWTDNADDEEGFIVQRKQGLFGSWQNIAQLPSNTEHYQDFDLLPNNSYTYRVYAYNQHGNSNYSNASSITTPFNVDAVAYRFFNEVTGGHFYTICEIERDHIINDLPHWIYEGAKFRVNSVPASGNTPVYRFFNTNTGIHFYTISQHERDTLIDHSNWDFEGIRFYVYSINSIGSIPVYRFFNTLRGGHIFTVSENERDTLLQHSNWNYEGTPFHVFPLDSRYPEDVSQ